MRKPRVSAYLLSAIFVVLFCRLFQIQVLEKSKFVELARKQQTLLVKMPATRGEIVDCRNRKLATNVPIESIYAEPRSIEDKVPVIASLVTVLDLPREAVAKKLLADKSFVWVDRHVDRQKAERIRAMRMPNVQTLIEKKRVYPGGETASHILGFTDIDGMGLEGAELEFESYLSGVPGWRVTGRDAVLREVPALETSVVNPIDGCNVVLTIDEVMQHTVERHLDRAYNEWGAKGAIAVVMEPRTGAVLALANRPTYDPNAPRAKNETESRRNRAITDCFEPGSVFKTVTACAALEEGLFSPDDVIYCENGAYRVGNRVLHDVHPYGSLPFKMVIMKSSNIGTVKIAQKLGPEKLQEYIKRFGFGKPTGIQLSGEAGGIVRGTGDWSGTSIANIPIGQGIAVTALQLVTQMSAIANEGVLMRPRIIQAMVSSSGTLLRESRPEAVRRVVSEKTAETMKEILVGAVEDGTGTRARVFGRKVAGKTGTAQKLEPDGTYSHTKFIASFVGFLPADDPVIAMVVVLDEPHPLYYGGTVSAPVFKAIAEEIMGYLENGGNARTLLVREGRM